MTQPKQPIDFTAFELVGRYIYRYYTNYWIIVGRLVNKQMYDLVNMLNLNTFTRDTIKEAMTTIRSCCELEGCKSFLSLKFELIYMIYNVNYNNKEVIEKMKDWDVLVIRKLAKGEHQHYEILCLPNDPDLLLGLRLQGEREVQDYIKEQERLVNEPGLLEMIAPVLGIKRASYEQSLMPMKGWSYALCRQDWMTPEEQLKCIQETVSPLDDYICNNFTTGSCTATIASRFSRYILDGCSDDALILLGPCYNSLFPIFKSKAKLGSGRKKRVAKYIIINSLFSELLDYIACEFTRDDIGSRDFLISVAEYIDYRDVVKTLEPIDNNRQECSVM